MHHGNKDGVYLLPMHHDATGHGVCNVLCSTQYYSLSNSGMIGQGFLSIHIKFNKINKF